MIQSVYISGTDTGIGKTLASSALLFSLRRRDLRALGMKPVASGCTTTAHGLRNADAETLIAASTFAPAYDDVNPYAFADPIAPHLAAADHRIRIEFAPILAAHARLNQRADCIVIEGVGGWQVPFGESLLQADLVRALNVPVLLVVGVRLGCINHALLSARAIAADGCRLLGWIANCVDGSMQRAEDNILSIESRIEAPLLGIIEHACNAQKIAESAALDKAVDVLLAHRIPNPIPK